MDAKPNILLITSDEQRWDQIGCLGFGGLGTPCLDRLAKEGLCLTRAYSASPTCTPARVSLLTGQYPSRHGAYAIGVTPDPFPKPMLPEAMKAAGYKTSLIGKHHFVRRVHEGDQAGADRDDIDYYRKWNGPWLGFDEVQLGSGHTKSGNPSQHYHAWLADKDPNYKQYFPRLGGYAPAYGAWDLPHELSDSAWVSENVCDIIEKNQDEPWFCWANFQDPHGPWVCPKSYYDQVDEDSIPTRYQGYQNGEFNDRPEFYQQLFEADEEWGEKTFRVAGEELGGVYGHADYEQHEREITKATVGMMRMLDDYLAKIIKKLEATGQAENTLVIFTADHGEMMGHHGLWGKGITAYDDCQRVPFIAWGPGMVKAQGVRDSIANLIDIPRTILRAAGTEIPQGVQGSDLNPLFSGEVQDVNEATLVEFRGSHVGYIQNTFVTKTHKLVVYADWEDGEYYDLVNDPDQYENLWHKQTKQRDEMIRAFIRYQLANVGAVKNRESFA